MLKIRTPFERMIPGEPNLKALVIHDKHYEQISPVAKLLARIFGKWYLGNRKYPWLKGELPFYLFRCKSCHNYLVDYPHSYAQFLGPCPFCLPKPLINQEAFQKENR